MTRLREKLLSLSVNCISQLYVRSRRILVWSVSTQNVQLFKWRRVVLLRYLRFCLFGHVCHHWSLSVLGQLIESFNGSSLFRPSSHRLEPHLLLPSLTFFVHPSSWILETYFQSHSQERKHQLTFSCHLLCPPSFPRLKNHSWTFLLTSKIHDQQPRCSRWRFPRWECRRDKRWPSTHLLFWVFLTMIKEPTAQLQSVIGRASGLLLLRKGNSIYISVLTEVADADLLWKSSP